MMISMLLIMLYNIADSIWVSGLGPDALAAIGFITPLFMVLVGLGNGIQTGKQCGFARNRIVCYHISDFHDIDVDIHEGFAFDDGCRRYHPICFGLW